MSHDGAFGVGFLLVERPVYKGNVVDGKYKSSVVILLAISIQWMDHVADVN
ncbi:hypothetical protein OFB58_25080 [Escherichia coli]|nr:hypothetical protein [Escherichia coli]